MRQCVQAGGVISEKDILCWNASSKMKSTGLDQQVNFHLLQDTCRQNLQVLRTGFLRVRLLGFGILRMGSRLDIETSNKGPEVGPSQKIKKR